MAAPDDLPILPFASREEWTAWLERHHTSPAGIWLKFPKKATGLPSVTYAEAVEVALCYGWIDGQAKGLDERWHLQRFTPRRARSRWSKLNREKALDLIARGWMRPAGLAEVERAQVDGRWDAAYDPPSRATVPDDLRAALDANAAAAATFEKLDAQNRYAVLHPLQNVKRPETRTRRIEGFVAQLAEGKPPYPQSQR